LIKLITYNRSTKDFDMFLDGAYLGSRERHIEAEVELDRLAYEALAHTSGPLDMARRLRPKTTAPTSGGLPPATPTP
jgi:hypothetical protein